MITLAATFETLDDVAETDLPRIGGKAFNCARLKQAGLPVPDGIVVPSDASDEDIRALSADRWLAAMPTDSLFAVRSSGLGEDSAGHSFAGIHETQLNVARDRVADAVLVCRQSAQSEQARAYRQARHLGDEEARIGILVQRMVPAAVSGVAFTVNPITGADELVINAAPGLGEDLVSGRVDPDEYRVAKGDRLLLSSRLGTRDDHAAAALTPWQRWTLLPRVKTAVRRIKQQYVWREKVRSDLTRVVASVREWHLALAARFVARGWIDRGDDYFLLRLDEVRRAIAEPSFHEQLREIALERAAQLAAERDLRMPLFMREGELEALLQQQTIAGSDGAAPLTGLCVSPGAVEAEVVVMRDPSEFTRMKRGAILVAPATDPSWTPLFTLASGVIVEVGGMLSHASTIAREYGLPALANVKHATSVLQSGARVRLDASGGRVVRL